MSGPRQWDVVLPDGAIAGRPVRVRIVAPEGEGPWPCALLVHGYGVSSEWGFWPPFAQRLAGRGIATARVAFSGDGVGDDLRTVEDLDAVSRATYVAELEDLRAVRARLDAVAELDTRRVALVGHSRGGGIGAIHAAEDGRYRAVALWGAFDAILRFSLGRISMWREQGRIDVMHHGLERRIWLDGSVLESAERNGERLDVLAACHRLTCPVLVVHGARDRCLPLSSARRIADAAPRAELVVIEDAGHAFGARDPLVEVPPRLERLLDVTTDWLVRQLPG